VKNFENTIGFKIYFGSFISFLFLFFFLSKYHEIFFSGSSFRNNYLIFMIKIIKIYYTISFKIRLHFMRNISIFSQFNFFFYLFHYFYVLGKIFFFTNVQIKEFSSCWELVLSWKVSPKNYTIFFASDYQKLLWSILDSGLFWILI